MERETVSFFMEFARRFLNGLEWKTNVCTEFAGDIKDECTIERVALVMSIVPCRELNLDGQE